MPVAPRPLLPILVSPWAGGARPRYWEAWLKSRLDAAFETRFTCPRSLDELTDAARAAAREAPVLVVAGGDGTLHHVVNAIGDAEVALAPIPVGSGNDFCRGIGLGRDPERALAALRHGHTRLVDVLDVNGRRVITVGGVGVVAASALHTGRLLAPSSPWRPLVRRAGRHAYLALAGGRLLFHPRIAAAARVEWRELHGAWGGFEGPLLGAFLATLPTLGAGLRLPIHSLADDGVFELALLPRSRRTRVVRFLPRLRHGRTVPPDVLQVHRVIEATLVWTGGTPVVGDGEALGAATVVSVRVLPQRLRVVSPPVALHPQRARS